MNDELDPDLMAKVLRSVRVTVIGPFRFRVTHTLHGKETDTHVFEFMPGTPNEAIQKEVVKVCKAWKGFFAPGSRCVIERLSD